MPLLVRDERLPPRGGEVAAYRGAGVLLRGLGREGSWRQETPTWRKAAQATPEEGCLVLLRRSSLLAGYLWCLLCFAFVFVASAVAGKPRVFT